MPDLSQPLSQIEPLRVLADRAEHVDVQSIESDVSLRAFVAGMFSYFPWWMRLLYALRWGFVRVLGLRQDGIPTASSISPDAVPMTPGAHLQFFTVGHAEDGRYWIASASEPHLTAHLAVVITQQADQRTIHVVTLVQYHRWTGPVYFKAIRPFHYLVVRRMMQAGAAARSRDPSTCCTAPSAG